jgi:glutathione S-transferase
MSNTFYSSHHCPDAIRAHLAITYSKQQVALQELSLKKKPAVIPAESSGPCLQLSNGDKLNDSLEIMIWALERSDPDGWLDADLSAMLALIDENDFEFKPWLNRYSEDFPHPKTNPGQQAEDFLYKLESRLLSSFYLFGEKVTLADIAIFPFIRQLAEVDRNYFEKHSYPQLQKWLNHFNSCAPLMEKSPA